MSKDFSKNERRICRYFSKDTEFTFNGNHYRVMDDARKPLSQFGECKTDIYFKAKNLETNSVKEFKISYKQHNAEFLENKTNAERAEFLLGPDWKELIQDALSEIKDQFEERKLIFKDKYFKTEQGSITLGWKFELLKVKSGALSGDMNLTYDQKYDVYAGTTLPDEKKNPYVGGIKIENAGIAEYVFEDDGAQNAQEVINSIKDIGEYLQIYPGIYFACKALNYRTYKHKDDGARPLAVYVKWYINDNNKLDCELVYDNPLITKGNVPREQLLSALKQIQADTVDDLNEENVENFNIVYKKEVDNEHN